MRRLTPLGAVVLVMMVMTTRQWADYDIFWHLANGRLMVEAGSFPSPDRFSWSMAGQVNVAYSAQFDRLFYLLWRSGGAPALSLVSALLFGLTLLPYVLLIGGLAPRPVLEALALLLIVLAVAPYRGARPHMVAFALFGLLAYVLEQPFGIRKGLVAGMALGAWANLHGTFYFGFGLVGGAVVAWSLAHERRLATMATLALVIGAGLSLLSPYGLRVWSYPLQTASNPYLIYNDDWASLRPLSPNGVAMGLLLLIAIGVGLRPATDPRVIASLGLVLPAIHIARFSPFAAPLLAFVSLRRLVELRPGLRLPLGSPMLALTGSAMAHRVAGMLLLCGTLLLIPTLPPSLEGHRLAGRGHLPTRAVDLLLACGEPAPVWNDYNWGGYLMWRGDGRYTVGIDGRAETLYSNQVFDDYFRVWRRQEGWGAIVQASPARYTLMPSDNTPALDTLPGWRRVYQDDIAILSARDGAPWHCRQ